MSADDGMPVGLPEEYQPAGPPVGWIDVSTLGGVEAYETAQGWPQRPDTTGPVRWVARKPAGRSRGFPMNPEAVETVRRGFEAMRRTLANPRPDAARAAARRVRRRLLKPARVTR